MMNVSETTGLTLSSTAGSTLIPTENTGLPAVPAVPIFAGIDVSKARLDLAFTRTGGIRTGEQSKAFNNDAGGVKLLLVELKKVPHLGAVLFDATGGLF